MNVMTTEVFEPNAGPAADAAQQRKDAALARLMKAWESKNARAAKRAAGLSFIAVTLAACGSSSGSGIGTGDNGNGDNGSGENGGTTPVSPMLPEPNFFVLDFPTMTVKQTVFNVDGQPVSVEDALAAFAELADVTLPDGENITIENLNVVQEAIGGTGFGSGDGENIINIGGAGSGQQLTFDEFLDLLQTQEIITVGRVILTPEQNSGIVFAPGFAPGDQFTEGEFGTAGNPGSGDDVIFFGRTELLHAAIIDGGAGNDTLVIVAKGNYAQPSAISNIQTVRILNSENTTVDVIASVEGQNILTEEDVNFQIVSTFPEFDSPETDDNTWIDLGSAFGLSSVVIGENAGVTDSNLFVVGVNNGATLVLQGGFENDITVSYGFNFGGTVFNLRLEDVNFEDGDLLIAQNSTHLAIESTGSDATVENFIDDGDFGGNLRQLTITGDKFLHIDHEVEFNEGRPVTIDAGANTGGVKLEAENDSGSDSIADKTINLIGSQGDDSFTLEADAFNITSGAGSNTFDLTGSYTGDLFEGMKLVFDGSAGTDTIILNSGANGVFGFEAMLAGSAITGTNNTLVLNDSYSLTEANLEGVSAIQMAPGAVIALTPGQVDELGAGVFSVIDGAEAVASLPGTPFGGGSTPIVAIVLDQDATLADLIDVSALDSGVKLAFRIPEDVTLTLTAEELHEHVADPGIWMGNDDTNPLESVGNLVITDAGPNFDPANPGFVDAPGQGLIPGGGTVFTTTGNNNVTVERSADGFERPSQDLLDDTLVIDSSDGPVEIDANAIGNSSEEFSIPQADTLIMQGENDITFTAPVSFDGQEDFTIDFSEVEGVVSGLEIVDFNNITDNVDPDDWGQVIGNGGARIDVQLDGNVGNANNGLISSGVATYVVTDLNEDDRQFWTSTPTEDLETLGLQGNYGNGITFGNVIAGVDFLMEVTSDKFDPAYSVGELTVVFARDDVADAVVNVVGLEDLPEGEVQTVEGITLGAVNGNDAASATINVEGGNTVIESLTGEFPALTITGDADVTVEGDLPVTLTSIDASGVVGVFTGSINNPDEDFSFLGAEGGTVLTLEDVDGENTIDGGVGGAELVIEGTVDLSESTLSNITSVTLTNGSDLTMTPQQVIDLGGLSSFNIEDGDTANLTLTVTEDFNVDDLDLANLPDGLTLELSLQSEVELNITGEQLADLLEAGVAITDGSAGDPAGTLNITGFTQANLQDADGNIFNYAPILADAPAFAGTITTDGSDLFVPSGYGAFPGLFDWELEGGTLGITVPGMANGLNVNNGDVQLFFTNFGGETIGTTGNAGIDASGFTNIGTVFVTEFFETIISTGEFNVESLAFLDSDTEVEIVPLVSPEFDGVDRMVIVGGVPFAIDDGTGAPFNPATGDAGPVTTGVDLLFNNVSGDSNRNVETVTIAFQEGGNIVGAITIGDGELPDGNAFETLTLISNGDDVNTILDDISAPGVNNLLTVNIQANQDLVIGDDPVAPTQGTIILSSSEAGADATVTITGDADVTVKGIDATDPDIATLTVDTSGHTGTYTVAGGSPSIDAGETLIFVGGADSTVELDTADLTPPDDGNLGVDGNGVLELLDASGMEGTLALGDVDNLADGFTLTGGTGVITGNIIALPSDDWSLDISGSAAGSAIDFVLDGDDATLTAGSVALATDPDSTPPGETTLTFGDNTALLIEGVLDLTSGFDNVVFGDDVVIELGEGGLVLMSDEQYADFVAAGGDIIGELSVIFDNDTPTPPGNDLTEVRGLEEIGLEEGSGAYTLTSEQVGIAFPVDGDGEPTADPGDINALKADPGLTVQVNEGETFNLTDVEADGLGITGEGAVEVEFVGTQGANLAVDSPAGANNVAGQSITVNYTLGGVAGSVVLTNSLADFTDASEIVNGGGGFDGLADLLDAVEGLEASGSGTALNVAAEEPGVAFEITSIDVVAQGGDPVVVEDTPVVVSDADFSGNLVDDTTHVFPPLGDGFYVFNGTAPGGSDPAEDYTVVLSGGNFVDATGASFAINTVGVELVGGLQLKLTGTQADDLAVDGDGVLRLENPGSADLSDVTVPTEIETLVPATTFSGTFPNVAVTILGDPDFEAGDTPNFLFMSSASNVPASLALVNAQVFMLVEQADGLSVTGTAASSATVTMGINNNALLGGIDVDLTLEGSGVDFGGQLPSGVAITFGTLIGSDSFTLVNSAIIPAGVITLANGTTVDVTGANIEAGVSIEMEAGSSLFITGAQADEMSIITIDGNGDPAPAVSADVTISDVQAGQDLSGIAIGGTLTVAFNDDTETEFTLPASAVAGNTVNVENVDPAGEIDTLTITDVEGSNADFGGLTVVPTGGTGDVVLELDSTGDTELGADADFGITNPGDVTLAISGTGSVTVDGDADLSGITAYTVEEDATLVVDASATGDAVVDTSLVSGEGTLQFVELGGQTATATEDVRFNEFVFESTDTGVTIEGFEAVGAIDGSFNFNGQFGTMSLDLSTFGTTGPGFDTIVVTDEGTIDFSASGVVVITDGTFASIDDFNFNTAGATDAQGAEVFFAVENGDDVDIYYWADDGAGTGNPNDGIADTDELTLIATLTDTDATQLGSDNFVI